MSENNKLLDEYRKLENRIWNTYKSRINTSERLKSKADYIDFISVYYSALLVVISILNLLLKSSIIEISSIVLSIMVTIFILYMNGQNLREKYIKMKKNYIDLSGLYYSVNGYISSLGSGFDNEELLEKFSKHITEYNELLDQVQNHSVYDFQKYKKQENIRNKGIAISDIKYVLNNLYVIFLKSFIFMIPTVITVYSLIELMKILNK
ncbi:MAG: SLATT domain-containing protein [Clostridia bacterium]|nr:SLATT domain-containing protein [Clostridia bacterium]